MTRIRRYEVDPERGHMRPFWVWAAFHRPTSLKPYAMSQSLPRLCAIVKQQPGDRRIPEVLGSPCYGYGV